MFFTGQISYEISKIFKNDNDVVILFISIILFFLVGFFDDKFNISATKRFLFVLIMLIPIIHFSDDITIKQIRLSFTDHTLNLPYIISILWSVLCFLLFINAINMFDGINFQVGLYSIYLSLFLF